jgi:hypothetical protein
MALLIRGAGRESKLRHRSPFWSLRQWRLSAESRYAADSFGFFMLP